MRNGHTKFMAMVVAAGLVSQACVSAAEPNAPKAPRPAAEARPLQVRGVEDRWTPTDAVMMLERSIRLLEPTPEQQKKIQAVLEAKNETMTAARKAYAEAGKALNEACSQGTEAAIRSAATKVGQTLGDLQVLRSKAAAELRAVLTPEQLKKLEQIKADATQRMQDMMRPARPKTEPGTQGAAAPSQPKPSTTK